MKRLEGKVTPDKKEAAVLKEWKSPFLPVFYTFKILGRFPFEKDELGRLRARLISAPSLWALLVTSFQLAVVINIYIWKFSNSKTWSSFNLVIASLQELIILNTTFYAVTTWFDTPAITRAYNRWAVFHNTFHTVIGREVVSPILNHTYLGVIFSFAFALGLFIAYVFSNTVKVYIFGLLLIREAVYTTCIFYFSTSVWCWVVYCLMVKKTAEIFKEHISQNFSQLRTPEKLTELRLLWVELHACTIDMSDAIGKTVITCQSVGYMLTLFSLYAGLMYVMFDNTLQLGQIPISLVHSHVSCILVYTLGHLAQQSMTENILFLLYSKRWQHLNSSVRRELDLLLDAIEMSSPCFELRGFLTMNRHGYIEVLNRILTYLIILLQIKVSADGAT